jgi:hypothetical protein
LFFAICDHFEPLHGGASFGQGLERVHRWREHYPALVEPFVDSDGRPPRYTFFYPGDQYDPYLVEPLAELVEMGLAEVEVHLHHRHDTPETLKGKLRQALTDLGSHGVLSEKLGQPAWAFIHGDWALANGRRDGDKCGVNGELPLLYELGCYGDFTFPSAPDETQPHLVNCMYYPDGDPMQPRPYASGRPVRVGDAKREQVLLLQGPLAATRRSATSYPWDISIENGALDHTRGLTEDRLRVWVDQAVSVEGRPDWTFVKVHAHGAPEANAAMLLGESTRRFHEALAREFGHGEPWFFHYVTARELYNLTRAAMDGVTGDPRTFFDYEIPPPARASSRRPTPPSKDRDAATR